MVEREILGVVEESSKLGSDSQFLWDRFALVNDDPTITRAILEVREAKAGRLREYMTLQNKAH